MRLAGSSLRPYRLPLTEPVVWGGTTYHHREGVLLRLGTDDGSVGWGDAAPLPGFSRETLAEATAALGIVASGLVGRTFDPHAVLRGPLAEALDAAGLPSSARFAVDLALTDLAAQATRRTLAHVLHPDPAVTLPLAGLILSGADAEAEAVRLVAAGYRTLKLKVGRDAPTRDAARVRAVRDAVGPAVALRLDANRAWTPDQVRAFAEGLGGVGIEFLEEPVADPADLPALWLDTALPLALDETLQHPDGAAHLRGWAAAAVLKPTLVGGMAATLRLAAQARAVGVLPVLSAAFESGVGMRGVAALAAATGGHAAGLDPYRWLARDVLADRLPLDRPTVDIPALLAQPVRLA